jgi:hypothetical protein
MGYLFLQVGLDYFDRQDSERFASYKALEYMLLILREGIQSMYLQSQAMRQRSATGKLSPHRKTGLLTKDFLYAQLILYYKLEKCI